MKKKTLRELIGEYGADGVIYCDAGNGSAGTRFVPCGPEADADDNEAAEHLLDVELCKCPSTDLLDEDMECPQSLADAAHAALSDYVVEGTLWASDWIEDDDRNVPYQADNPYRYRLIF